MDASASAGCSEGAGDEIEGAQMSQRKCWSSEVDSPLFFFLTSPSPLMAPGHGRLADSSAAPASSCSYGRFSADISGRPWRAFQLLTDDLV